MAMAVQQGSSTAQVSVQLQGRCLPETRHLSAPSCRQKRLQASFGGLSFCDRLQMCSMWSHHTMCCNTIGLQQWRRSAAGLGGGVRQRVPPAVAAGDRVVLQHAQHVARTARAAGAAVHGDAAAGAAFDAGGWHGCGGSYGAWILVAWRSGAMQRRRLSAFCRRRTPPPHAVESTSQKSLLTFS